MKTLILSDIHGSIHALEAILKQEKDSDLIYCAGDLVDYGPNPKEVVECVRENQIPCVKGNHDHWVVKNYRNGQFLESVSAEERAWVHHNASLLRIGERKIDNGRFSLRHHSIDDFRGISPQTMTPVS